MTRALMIQGTGSNTGKSLLVAGLCRVAQRRGLSVAPFKPQNMSNNAAVTPDGGEIGRAQALQARAAGLAPHTDMNPVLLKPESETGAQIVVQGKRLESTEARDYPGLKPRLMGAVLESFQRLKSSHDLILVEGAGSPAETNLRASDIANMGFATAAGVPVVLAGDIDRGGVIAQIVGTQAVLAPDDTNAIKGFLINKFRGDPRLFDDGYTEIENLTGWPGFGVLPWFDAAWRLPAEDVLDIASTRGTGAHIVCLTLPRISNFDDLDPLAQEPGVRLTMLGRGEAIPGDATLVILPGSKSTRADLDALRRAGWDIDLLAHHRRGGAILGLCGGYQMLGRDIADPEGIEGPPGTSAGLGLLNITTVINPEKRLGTTRAQHVESGIWLDGYEMHKGQTTGPDCARPFVRIDGRPEGAVSADGRVMGSYLHGMFATDAFRSTVLASLEVQGSDLSYDAQLEATLEALAHHMEAHLDIDGLLALAC
ncbi:MAG: cobyric acid synthase [Paracoccaceae bacterium]